MGKQNPGCLDNTPLGKCLERPRKQPSVFHLGIRIPSGRCAKQPAPAPALESNFAFSGFWLSNIVSALDPQVGALGTYMKQPRPVTSTSPSERSQTLLCPKNHREEVAAEEGGRAHSGLWCFTTTQQFLLGATRHPSLMGGGQSNG